MKRKVLKEILEYCKKVGTLDELEKALDNVKYERTVEGKTVKIRVYKGENGEEKTDILSMCDYRNTENMNLEELEKYYNELEEQYDDIEGDEPDESQNEEYEAWVEHLEEIEDEMDSVKEKMEALKGNP